MTVLCSEAMERASDIMEKVDKGKNLTWAVDELKQVDEERFYKLYADMNSYVAKTGTVSDLVALVVTLAGKELMLEENREKLLLKLWSEGGKDAKAAEADMVNRPPHYTSKGVECIDWIETALTPEEFRGYLKGTMLKYFWRHELKGNPEEDLDKLGWYKDKLKEKVETHKDEEPGEWVPTCYGIDSAEGTDFCMEFKYFAAPRDLDGKQVAIGDMAKLPNVGARRVVAVEYMEGRDPYIGYFENGAFCYVKAQ